MKHSPEDIAAAVNGYVKALRLLGRERTSYSEIAAALHIETIPETTSEDAMSRNARISERFT